MIFCGRLYRRAFVAFKTSRFFTFQSRLSGFKACFCFSGAFFFLTNGIKLSFFLSEILHQRNIAWTNPGTGSAFNAVSDIVAGCLIVLLSFTEPVKLLRQKIRRAGIGTGATTNAAFLFLRFTHFTDRWREKTVSDLNDGNIKPGKGEAHQWATHNHHLFSRRAKTGVIQQMTNRGA